MNLARVREFILGNAISISEQIRALFRALWQGVTVAVLFGFFAVVAAFSHSSMVAALLGIVCLLALGATGIVIYIAHTTLRDTTIKPLDDLSSAARRLGGGDLTAHPDPHGAVELQQIGSTLSILAHAVLAEREQRQRERRQSEKETTSMREILSITHDIGSHLEPSLILEQLANGAKRVGGYAEVIIWSVDDLDADLIPVHPPSRLSGMDPLRRTSISSSPVGRAASSGQTVQLREERGRAAGLAVPLTAGGVGLRVTGVVEVRGENPAEAFSTSPIDTLEALASYAATALAAAQLYEQLEMRSETDGLTKCFNRRKLDTDLRSEVGRSLRYGHPLTLIMVDIDHFKGINDTFGHQMGDEVLRVVASTIARGRETDAAYRFGGEEFAILLRETDWPSARAVAERMRIKIRESVATLKLPRDVTASLGIASIGDQVRTPEKLVEAADGALYEAKETGRNRVIVSPLTAPRATPGTPAVQPRPEVPAPQAQKPRGDAAQG